MYENLIKALREDAEWAEANEWEAPIALSDNLNEAADIIEELDANNRICAVQIEYLNKKVDKYLDKICALLDKIDELKKDGENDE